MKKGRAIVLGGLVIAVSGAAAFITLSIPTQEASAVSDPRLEPPLVRLATAARVSGSERGFTGIIGARVQSNLGFRVAGKIVERLVNAGEQVKAGQPLLRIDETDLRHALTAKRNAVAAARASAVQTDADERRYTNLMGNGWVSRQRYEQAKAASDTAKAQLAAARAEGRIGGRRKKLDPAKQREIAESVISGRKSGAEMARLYNVSQPTISRIVAALRRSHPLSQIDAQGPERAVDASSEETTPQGRRQSLPSAA
jgi:multidrug efflux pump subunit AcrA (membrane-fusion protein)